MRDKKTQVKSRNDSTEHNVKFGPRFVPAQDDAISRDHGDGLVSVLPHSAHDYYFVIDGIAAEFWKMIDGVATVQEIVNKLSQRYGVSESKLMRDVTSFLKELRKEGMIKK